MCSTWNIYLIIIKKYFMKISGRLVDIHKRTIFPATVCFEKGIITAIEKIKNAPDYFILPGLIDAHVHIESSMVTPGAFARTAVQHGTTSVVSDPHEIANVLGIKGINFMINDAKKVPMKFWFGAPSCVPATNFETSGATITSMEIEKLLLRNEIKYLSEMMNFPGVVYDDEEVWKKIHIANKLNKPIDGHAPGLTGEMLRKYVSAGISTDHECSSLEEADEKISLGMKILIREGSAARNLTALKNLIGSNPDMVMLCSDDLHPETLMTRHINKLVSGLISEGYDLFDVIKTCTLNPALHYGLDAGLLKPGQAADFILIDDYRKMNVLETWINGNKVFDRGTVLFTYKKGKKINRFCSSQIKPGDIEIQRKGKKILVMEAFDGELLTKKITKDSGSDKYIECDTETDVLKIVVKDRYNNGCPAVGFIKGFGLKQGAFASSVAHDSHNIICVGTNDIDITAAINEIVKMKGGLSVSTGGKTNSLRLAIAGIMSDNSCEEVALTYEALSDQVRAMGSPLRAPFMTLSFMALLVIPELKIGDKGLFDVNQFRLVDLFVE
jgi:adenine deaminase